MLLLMLWCGCVARGWRGRCLWQWPAEGLASLGAAGAAQGCAVWCAACCAFFQKPCACLPWPQPIQASPWRSPTPHITPSLPSQPSPGANPNIAKANGLSPIHVAAYEGQVGALRALLAAGASAKTSLTSNRSTPLHLAARAGQLDCMRELLGVGVPPNAISEDGVSALHVAAINGDADAIELLLARGAKVGAAMVWVVHFVFQPAPQLAVGLFSSVRGPARTVAPAARATAVTGWCGMRTCTLHAHPTIALPLSQELLYDIESCVLSTLAAGAAPAGQCGGRAQGHAPARGRAGGACRGGAGPAGPQGRPQGGLMFCVIGRCWGQLIHSFQTPRWVCLCVIWGAACRLNSHS